jgi:hypothetical protein
MARKHDGRRSERRTRRRPAAPRRAPAPRAEAGDDEMLRQPLLQGLDAALANPHPLELLVFASSIASLTEPDPLAALRASATGRAEHPHAGRSELIDSFLEAGLRQTDALLLALKELIGDDLTRRRIRTTVADRKRPVPGWLLRLDQVRPTRAVEFGHILRDGENIVLGIDLPGGRPLTVLVYIDHNLGTVVKDAFALEAPLDEVMERLGQLDDEQGGGGTVRDLPLADARARIEQAIATGRMFLEPLESETWPLQRPLVEWMLRLMPDGGTGYPEPEWTQEQIDTLADAFFASRDGEGLDDAARRDLIDDLLWFGAEYGPGDPLHLSPVSIELIMLDRVPRKVVGDAAYLDLVPELLRALTRFAHGSRGVPPQLTRDTLAAIDEFEPEYRAAVRTPHHQGPMALLERMGTVGPLTADDDEFGFEFDDETAIGEYFRRMWADAVGGIDALQNLDASPLPIEPLDLSAVGGDIHDKVTHVGRLVAEACAVLFDDEFRTACYRMLARIAEADPVIFRRSGRADTAAAALMWIALKNNAQFGTYNDVTVKALMEQLGLTGSPAQRAQPMLAALGVAHPSDWGIDATLGDPTLLTSRFRGWLIERRDRLTAG